MFPAILQTIEIKTNRDIKSLHVVKQSFVGTTGNNT